MSAADGPVPLREPSARRDVLLLMAAGFSRTLGVGMSGVVLLVVLAAAHHDRGEAYAVLAAGLTGSAVGLALITLRGDRWGRRRTLVALSLCHAIGGMWLFMFAGS